MPTSKPDLYSLVFCKLGCLLEEIEDTLGDELGPEIGSVIAAALFSSTMAYLAANNEVDADRPCTRKEAALTLGELCDLAKGVFGTMIGKPVEMEMRLLAGSRVFVGVVTRTESASSEIN